jgi:uncharacterized protein (DUF1330 family)
VTGPTIPGWNKCGKRFGSCNGPVGACGSPNQPLLNVEFDSYDIARSAHDSEAYQQALQALGSGAERDVRIMEGV